MSERIKTMATITKSSGKYRVRVRRNGHSLSETFTHKKDAELFGKQKELELERGDLPVDPKVKLKGVTLGQLVIRYQSQVSPTKKGAKQEIAKLGKFLGHPICAKAVADIKAADFAEYRDFRLASVAPMTAKRELAIVQNVYKVAKRDWGLPIKINPVAELEFSPQPVRRDRRPTQEELDAIIGEAKRLRNHSVLAVIEFSLETGMRRSEILNMRWRHLDLKHRTLLIPDSKNGTPRKIPLSLKAMAVLEGLDPIDEVVFPINPHTFNSAWTRIIKKLEIAGLRFHDNRHDCISRLFEHGLHIGEVSAISGHKDWKSLKIYTNPRPADIIKKLDLGSKFGGQNAAH
jgi:integrase